MNYSRQATLWREFRASTAVPSCSESTRVLPPSTHRPAVGTFGCGDRSEGFHPPVESAKVVSVFTLGLAVKRNRGMPLSMAVHNLAGLRGAWCAGFAPYGYGAHAGQAQGAVLHVLIRVQAPAVAVGPNP